MKRLIALSACLAAVSLCGCADTYGHGARVYAGGPSTYEGFYDDFYGPLYDGYWGGDGFFYYRRGSGDTRFRRGDAAHFSRGAATGTNFHPIHGSMTPSRGMSMPHFRGTHGSVGGRGRR